MGDLLVDAELCRCVEQLLPPLHRLLQPQCCASTETSLHSRFRLRSVTPPSSLTLSLGQVHPPRAS
jgi:hypothetical protein